MPNWCHCKLTLTGDPDEVEKAVKAIAAPNHGELVDDPYGIEEREAADGSTVRIKPQIQVNQPLDFQRIVPMPAELLESEAWYEWAIQNWGTKWNANFDGPFMALGTADADPLQPKTAIETPGHAFYPFDTAWSPPVPIAERIAARFPKLEVELAYAEVGNDYAGRMTWRRGGLHEESECPVDEILTDEEMWF